MKIKDRRAGFTFIEVIIASALIVIVGFALYQVFSQGTRLWNRIAVRQGNIDYMIFSERMMHDLQNSFLTQKEKFEGDSDAVEFNTMAISRGGGREEIYRVRYAFDTAAHSIKRMSWDLKEILNRSPGKTTTVLSGVRSCKLQYFGAEKSRGPEWTNRFSKACIPEAIKISLEYQHSGSNKVASRIMLIPQGGCTT